MRAPDRPDRLILALHPRLADDVPARVPHQDAAQDPAQGHGYDAMACQRLDAPASAPHEPELLEHGEDADEEPRHAQGVNKQAGVHVRVEDRRRQERPKCRRRDRQRVLVLLVGGPPTDQHCVQEAEDEQQGIAWQIQSLEASGGK